MAKFLVSTAIPYVNDKPHLGHAMLFTYGDVVARWRRQAGDSVLFSVGTDEHGGKMLEAAKAASQEPQAFADGISKNFQDLCQLLNIKYDQFVRTTSPAHVKVAQDLWQKISKDIQKGKYVGWYCTGCERFYTEQEVKTNKGNCPDHNRPFEKFEEENYIFMLSKYTKQIKELIEKNELKVVPASRRNEILGVLKTGLQDLSFSRPKAKIPWGVEVPGDPTQVMYVWTEALMNYLTATGYPAAGYEKWWPTDVNVIGKDLIRFHAAIWPAILLSAGLPLPKAIYAHGFVTAAGGKKMGKSLGNAVKPAEIVQKYGADGFRYYFLHEIPSNDDGEFSWERLQATYESDLANDLGNLVQRTIKMVSQYQKGVVGNLPQHSHDIEPFYEAMANFRFDRALDEIWLLIKGLNQYVDEQKPWEIAKKGEVEHLTEVLAYLVANILQVANLLEPFLPTTAEKIQKTFADGLAHPEVGVLFPKLEPTEPKL